MVYFWQCLEVRSLYKPDKYIQLLFPCSVVAPLTYHEYIIHIYYFIYHKYLSILPSFLPFSCLLFLRTTPKFPGMLRESAEVPNRPFTGILIPSLLDHVRWGQSHFTSLDSAYAFFAYNIYLKMKTDMRLLSMHPYITCIQKVMFESLQLKC